MSVFIIHRTWNSRVVAAPTVGDDGLGDELLFAVLGHFQYSLYGYKLLTKVSEWWQK